MLLLNYPSAPHFLLPFSGSFILFLPPPDLSPIVLHLPPVNAASLPPCTVYFFPLYCPVAEQLSILTALPPAGCHHSSTLSSHAGRLKGVPRTSRACRPLSGCPPLPSSTCAQVLVEPRVILSKGPFLPLPASITHTPASLPSGLDRRPSHLLVTGGGVAFFVPLSPVLPPHPPRVPLHLLVSS